MNESHWHRFRYRLAQHDAVVQLSLVGAISGLITGLVIALFRYGVEWFTLVSLGAESLDASAAASASDNFEVLSLQMRFLLPLLGAIFLGLLFQFLPTNWRHTGLSHVLVQLHKKNGEFSIRNALTQFFGGIIALASGQSGGREGPAIHLGAAANSIVAKRFHLPNNTMRILTACGAAAAIGASFNTPIAGVIFAMEVIMMEYTVVGFLPVILASVTATSITQVIFGGEPVFSTPSLSLNSFWELPFLLLLGVFCGLAATLFMRIQLLTRHLQRLPVFVGFSLAGLLTASIAVYLPGVLGIGYDTVNAALNGNTAWVLMLALLLAKIVTTAVANGIGMPIGIIGPSLFIGAGIGSVMGVAGAEISPELASDVGFYALLGMGGMMGALLNAPLAALLAILELAHTPEAILPGITVIVIATLSREIIFGQHSAIASVLNSQSISLSTHPVAQALNRISLNAVIDTKIEILVDSFSTAKLTVIAEQEPRAIVIVSAAQDHFLMTRKCYLKLHAKLVEEKNLNNGDTQDHNNLSLGKSAKARALSGTENDTEKKLTTDRLLELVDQWGLPISQLQTINICATVTEARTVLSNSEVDGLFVFDAAGPKRGILKKDALNKLIASW